MEINIYFLSADEQVVAKDKKLIKKNWKHTLIKEWFIKTLLCQ